MALAPVHALGCLGKGALCPLNIIEQFEREASKGKKKSSSAKKYPQHMQKHWAQMNSCEYIWYLMGF